jgi:hypothetical protein
MRCFFRESRLPQLALAAIPERLVTDTVPFSPTQAADDDRRMLGKAMLRLFELWNLTDAQSAALLGFEAPGHVLSELRSGGSFPAQDALIERARALLRIHRQLQLLLPSNPQVAAKWVQAPDERLDGNTPFDTIRRDGAAGANRIISLLERQIAR